VSLAYGILTKSSLGLMLPILVCGAFWGWYKQLALRQAIRRVALFAISPSLAAVYLLSVNAYLFGDPQDFGYRGESFSMSFQKGFADLTVGLDKGILWFAPLVILAPAGVWKLRNHVIRWFGPVLASCSAAYLLLIACWYGYRGGNCWGPRLLMPVLPLLLLLAGAAMGGLIAKRVAVALLVAGFVVNLLGVLIYYQAYYTVAHSARKDIDWREPCFSQIPGHFWLLRVQWSKGGLNAPEEASPLWKRPTWISRYPEAIPPPYSHYEDPILNPWPFRLELERPRLRRAEIWYLRALLEIAIMKYEHSDLAGAMRLIQEGLKMDANHPPLVAAAGMIYYTAGQMEPALAQFNLAITLDAGYEMGWFGRGLVMEALKNPAAARQAYMRLLEMPLRTLDQAQIRELLAHLQE